MSTPNICCVCLETAQSRGGVPIHSPGCCGKWFHQTCMDELILKGIKNCPACRAEFVVTQTQQQPAPVRRGSFMSTLFGGSTTSPPPPVPTSVFTLRSPNQMNIFANREVSNLFAEDLIVAAETVVEMEEGYAEPVLPVVTTNSSPEFPVANLSSSMAFYVRVGVKYEEQAVCNVSKKVPLDIVCILDNSGSMGGGKLSSLKEAMKFVIGTLSARDRLSIVYFNSRAGAVHGLLKMTAENKQQSRDRLDAIVAEGGTDIYDGMHFGWSVLQQRTTFNPASCVFLLTDGQDRGRLDQKKELARSIKAQGTSLFVFGFGADHDSEHMTAIASAAECPFTYIESDDMVVDAFGGSIGTQQGAALRNITLNVTAQSQGVTIAEVLSGSYAQTRAADGRSASVSFANMYEGEARDVLFRLELPRITAGTDIYQLLSAVAVYSVQSTAGSDATRRTSSECVCVVQRASHLDPLMARDVQVDVQVNRIKVTRALSDALSAADSGNFASAKEILSAAHKLVLDSVSFRTGNAVAKGLVVDLVDALSRVQSRDQYAAGGRAMMSEATVANDRQRSCYTKAGKVNNYQSSSSASCQAAANTSKGGWF